MNEIITKSAEIIKNAKYLVVLTGAGISAESGIPTFRGKDGLWKNYNAMDLATPEAFTRDPKLVWEFYTYRQKIIQNTKPNAAHEILKKWENEGILKYVITQNVDGLHERTGLKNILRLHGYIWGVKCTKCDYKGELDKPAEGIPKCPKCNAMLRPDVVWFGESLDPDIINRAYEEFSKADVALIIGTSAVVYPAAYLPYIVREKNGKIIEINPNKTPLTEYATVSLHMNAGEAMRKIDKEIQNKK